MSTLILAQNEQKLRGNLDRYRLPRTHPGSLVDRFTYGVDAVLRSPSGAQVYTVYINRTAARIVRSIVQFALMEMANQQNDLVTVRIVAMYHQTSRRTVRTLATAFQRLPRDPLWRRLPWLFTKHLQVSQVVLLSCESGIDKTFVPTANPPTQAEIAMRYYAAQARGMRIAAGKGFVTPQAPPPAVATSWYDPEIITFSTGDADTGGIELNPFGAKFKKLPGRFRANGKWSYDPTPPGVDQDTFRAGTDTAGTSYSDGVNSGQSSSTAVPAGGVVTVVP